MGQEATKGVGVSPALLARCYSSQHESTCQSQLVLQFISWLLADFLPELVTNGICNILQMLGGLGLCPVRTNFMVCIWEVILLVLPSAILS
jgi:hypothetical protein